MMFTLFLSTVLAAPPVPPVTAAAYSPDGKTLVAGTRGEIVVLDAMTGDSRVTLKGLTGRVTAIAWVSNTRFAVAAGEPSQSGTIAVFDLLNPKPVTSWNAHKDSIFSLAVMPDGKTLASAGYDRIIKLWNIASNPSTPRMELKDHSDTIYALAIHPNGKLLASGSADRAVKVWDLATGKRLYTLGDSTDWVYSLAWSPDGSRLAAAGVDKSLRVWKADAKGGTLDRSAFAHAGPVVKLAYAADGKSIVTAGEDRVVKVWEASTLKEKATFPAQPDSVLALAVHPNGKQIAVGRFDGTLTVLDATTGKVLQTPLPVKPVPPKVFAATPSFLPRGKISRITLTGMGLDKTTTIRAKNVKVEIKMPPTATILTADVTVPANHPVGPIELFLQSEAGPSSPVLFTVERFAAIAESGSRDSLTSAMPVSLNSTLVGTLNRAGAIDYYRFEAKAGQPLGIAATAKFAPLLTLFDPNGIPLAESSSGTLGIVCPVDGKYGLAIRDRDYRGGAEMTYRVNFGNVPVVTGIFPPAIAMGTTTTVHVSGVNLTAAGMGVTIPVTVASDEMKSSIDLMPLLKLIEKPEGRATVAVESIPAVVVNGADARLPKIPFAADGVLATPGSSMTVKFMAKKGEPLIVEGLARRYGSPVDPQIEILDSVGKPVPRATLRCVAKTYLTFRDHDSAKPGLRLETWNELAANDLLLIDNELIKIRNLPGHPDADCDFFAVNGVRSSFFDTTPTHHALNSPMYKVEMHPVGATVSPNGMPVFPLDYRNDDGGPGYGKDARLFFSAPADGEYRVRLTDARGFGGPNHNARVTVRPPRPDIKVTFSPNAPKVWKGGTVPINVNIERLDGFNGPVAVSIADLPQGIMSIAGRIEAGFYSTTLGITAAPDAATTTVPFKLVAKFKVGEKEIWREVVGKPIATVEPGDLVTTTKTSSLAFRPGEETRFVVAVERRNGFQGRIPIDVRGLPHGVIVQNIGLNAIMITESETEREVVLRAEPWVEPTSVPVLVVARQETKKAEHAATPMMLTIKP